MNQQQVEQLRWAALEYMACRSTCAFTVDQVTRGLKANGVQHQIGVQFSDGILNAELHFLSGEGLLEKRIPPMSAIPVYQVTSKGTLAWERKRIEEG